MVKTNSDVKSIRKKLLAAVAMLLVASIMVVSSSYAWFTLSTAPEVTGIQTSVGSNGNLEMALREGAGTLSAIQTSDGGLTFPQANNYWGNLVDLSAGKYHLNEIALLPARLNAVVDENASVQAKGGTDNKLAWKPADGGEVYYADAKANTGDTPVWEKTAYKLANGGYLKTPVYGADGRLSALEANTVNGVYNDENKAFVAGTSGNKYGVQAVGVTSQISPAALVLRNAKLAVNNAITEGKGSAVYSLRYDAVKLAQIYVASTINNSTTATEEEVGYIRTTVSRLNAILVDLENALKEAVVAIGVSEGESFTADKVSFSADAITVDGVTLEWNSFTGATEAKADLLRAYRTLQTVKGTLTTAASNLNSLQKTGDTYDMTAVTNILSTLLSSSDFLINGKDVETLRTSTVSELLSMVSGTVNMEIKGGVYYVIAQLVGNYSGSTSMSVYVGEYAGQQVGTLNFENVVMSTNIDPETAKVAGSETLLLPNGFHLPYVQGWLSQLTPHGNTEAEAELITDIYGYIIDLAFRTNATGSTLQLQTDAANRVNDSAATQGAGSYMEFTVANADYTVKQMIDLLQNVRVVFVGNDDVICGVAKLDVEYGPAMTMPETPAEGVTYITGTEKNEDGTFKVHQLTAGTLTDNTVKAALYLYNYEVKPTGELEVTTKKTSSDITSLQQNVPVGVSTLVYLDGDNVENGDVAISGNSMTGTMNLQFSSSASLTPMNYTFQDKVAKPALSIAENKLVIDSTDAEADYGADTKFIVYVNGTALPAEYDAAALAAFDLTTAPNLEGGVTYSIAVAAKEEGKLMSDKSDPVNWQKPM